MNKKYPTDLTDSQWNHIKDFFPMSKETGRPHEVEFWQIINTILFLLFTGVRGDLYRLIIRNGKRFISILRNGKTMLPGFRYTKLYVPKNEFDQAKQASAVAVCFSKCQNNGGAKFSRI